jgi:hypothetical protein
MDAITEVLLFAASLIIIAVALPFFIAQTTQYTGIFVGQATVSQILNQFHLNNPLIYGTTPEASISNFGPSSKITLKMVAQGCNENVTKNVFFKTGTNLIQLPPSCTNGAIQQYTLSFYGGNTEYMFYNINYINQQYLKINGYTPETILKINGKQVEPELINTSANLALPLGIYNVTVYNPYYLNQTIQQFSQLKAAPFQLSIPALIQSELQQVKVYQVINGVNQPLSLAKVSINYNSTVATTDSSGVATFPYMSKSIQLSVSCPLTTCAGAGTSVSNNYTSFTGLFPNGINQSFYLYPMYETKVNLKLACTINQTINSTSYLPVTITNKQNTATSTPFQQMITVDSAAYTKYINGNFGNVRFYYGNTPINSWCESGCSNTSTNTVVWLKLPMSIPPSSDVQINMTFLNMSTNYNGNTAGEAPELSATYGQYDNGAKVFNNYWNFAGTTIPTGLTLYGNTLKATFDNGFSIGSGDGTTFIYASISSDLIAEAMNQQSQSLIGETTTAPTEGDILPGSGTNGFYSGYLAYYHGGQTGYIFLSNSSSYTGIASPTPQPFFNISSFYTQTGSQLWCENYNCLSASNTIITIPTTTYLSIGSSGGATYYWLRTRAYPPNGVMPSVIFGSVAQHTQTLTSSISTIAPTSGSVNFVSILNSTLSRNKAINASGQGIIWLPSGNYIVSGTSYTNLVSAANFTSSSQNQTFTLTFQAPHPCTG